MNLEGRNHRGELQCGKGISTSTYHPHNSNRSLFQENVLAMEPNFGGIRGSRGSSPESEPSFSNPTGKKNTDISNFNHCSSYSEPSSPIPGKELSHAHSNLSQACDITGAQSLTVPESVKGTKMEALLLAIDNLPPVFANGYNASSKRNLMDETLEISGKKQKSQIQDSICAITVGSPAHFSVKDLVGESPSSAEETNSDSVSVSSLHSSNSSKDAISGRKLHSESIYSTTLPASLPLYQGISKTNYGLSSTRTDVKLSCWHAKVAQKSYGAEKRFLCPPPKVSIESFSNLLPRNFCELPIKMSVVNGDDVVCSTQEAYCTVSDGENPGANCTSFKQLHVSSTAKSKSFSLYVNVLGNYGLSSCTNRQSDGFIKSNHITIISKPSKKNKSNKKSATVMYSGDYISLYSRLNSQTVRTRHICISEDLNEFKFCASSGNWDPIMIWALDEPVQMDEVCSDGIALRYGMKIALSDIHGRVQSKPMIIRRVEKNKISRDSDGGHVCQMHRVAFEIAEDSRTSYWGWGSTKKDPHSLVQFESPTSPDESICDSYYGLQVDRCMNYISAFTESDGTAKVGDHICWTMVGVDNFQAFLDNKC